MRRLILPLLAALALAGCGKDAGQAFLDSRTPPSLGPRFWKPDGWAWGVIRIQGAPEIRYGVAAPAIDPGGKVMIIATGYGESAEVYYETVRDLNTRGWSVWVVEPHGQGGSGRFPGARDVGRSAGFDKDAAAIRWLVENVIRPSQADDVVLAAHGSAAYAALWAAEHGLRNVDRVVVWSPDPTEPRNPGLAERLTRLGMGGLRASGSGWKRPTVNLTGRSTLPQAWPVANPDLRMGGPGWSWYAARVQAYQAVSPEYFGLLAVPTEIRSTGDFQGLCESTSQCRFVRAPKQEHLAGDPIRTAWLDDLTSDPAHHAE